MALIGIGFRSISMSPASIGPVKAMILGLDVGVLEEHVKSLLKTNIPSLRPALSDFAGARNVPI
jgi:phosphotransferase system enzyme I (PtsP)